MYFEQPGVTEVKRVHAIPPNKEPANSDIYISNFSNNINVNHEVNMPKP
jgi:hypothetical protein